MTSRRTFIRVLGLATVGAAVGKARGQEMEVRGAPGWMQRVQHSTMVMGQVATITAYHRNADEARAAITEAFGIFRRADELMSVFSTTSDIGRINDSEGRDPVTVDLWTGAVIAEGLKVARATHGMFDPTVEPLMRVWGFREKRKKMPTEREIRAALEALGAEHVQVLGAGDSVAVKNASVKLDLGGIAVGAAIDRAADAMRTRGIASALIDVSGDLYAIGAPPNTAGWDVGIVDPHNTKKVIAVRTISNEALCTSGNYQNVVIYHAKKYGHIMNTGDGHPAHALASATVIAPRAITADAYCKPAFIDPAFTLDNARILRVMNNGTVAQTPSDR